MPWYSAGTVAVTNNSPTVTGSGTSFSANARVGDAFRGPDGLWYEVTNVASATVISIKPNYQGASNAAGSYAIAPMQGYVKDSADALRGFVNQYGSLLASLGPIASWQPGTPFLLSGLGVRVQADFSNATHANRTLFQTSAVNGGTVVGAMPNGTANSAYFQCYGGNGGPDNSSFMRMGSGTGDGILEAGGIGSGAQAMMRFITNSVERIRILPSSAQGQVHFHTAGANPMGQRTPGAMITADCSVDIYNPNAQGRCLGMAIGSLNGGVGNMASFYYNPGSLTFVGSISTNGTTTSYNTTSDRRLKDQIEDADADEAWSRLDSYCIRSFVFKSMPDVRIEYAGIADELQLVNPDMVTGEKDAVLAYGTVYTLRPVGTLYAQGGEVIAVEVEEPEEHSGYWHPTGAREFVEREDVLPPTDDLPGKRWEKTREEILPQVVDWSKAVPELILNLQTAKAMILELQRELSEVRQAISA